MRRAFKTGFRAWMEASAAKDAVLGVVGGGQEVSGAEKEHLLSRNTKDFSSSIRGRLKQLGVVKSIGDMNAKAKVIRAIDDGITVSDLIRRVRGGNITEDVYESEVESMDRHADIRKSMALQEPKYLGNRDSFVRKMMARGMSREEADKKADALFPATRRI